MAQPPRRGRAPSNSPTQMEMRSAPRLIRPLSAPRWPIRPRLPPPPPHAPTTANMSSRTAGTTTASYQIYNLGANSTLAASALGQVGSDWGFVTLGNFNLSDPSDMLLRNSSSGAFQVYDIADNNIIGSSALDTVGTNWQPLAVGSFGPCGRS